MSHVAVLAYVAVGAITLVVSGLGIQRRARILRDWIELQGAVVRSAIERVGPFWTVAVSYEYHSGDRHYLAEARPWPLPTFAGHAERIAATFEPGDVITVLVSPDDHGQSVMQPAPSAWLCLVGLLLSASCFGVAVLSWLELPQ